MNLMPHPKAPDVDVNAASVAADSVTAGTGHVVTVVVGAIAAILMPRLLGIEHFGLWVLFRSIILLATNATRLGARQIMSRFYAPLAATDSLAADRLFKAVAGARFLLGVASATFGYVLLRLLGAATFDRTAALLLALAIMFRTASVTGSVLLYGTTQIRRLAILHFLMAAFVPLWVMGGYLLGGFVAIPAACAVGEGLVMLTALGFAQPSLAWPKGWPRRERLLEILHFGGHVAPATLGAGVFVDITVCLAAVLGASEAQMAFIGLAIRLRGMVLSGLLAMNRAILPSLSVMADQNRIDHSMNWISLLCRTGSVFILAATAATVFIGRPLIVLIWGSDFLPALLPICLGLAAALPMWLASTHVNLAFVINRPDMHLRSVAWLYAGAGIVLFGLPMLPIPERILLAMTAGNAFCMASLIIALRRNGCTLPHLHRIWVVTAVALLPVVFMNQIADRLSIAAPWALVFIATVLVSKCLYRDELKRMVKQVIPSCH
jgi:O-antigen/teichoic acid export membrane protein